MGFEPATPEIKWLKIFARDRSATVFGARLPCEGYVPVAVAEDDHYILIITKF